MATFYQRAHLPSAQRNVGTRSSWKAASACLLGPALPFPAQPAHHTPGNLTLGALLFNKQLDLLPFPQGSQKREATSGFQASVAESGVIVKSIRAQETRRCHQFLKPGVSWDSRMDANLGLEGMRPSHIIYSISVQYPRGLLLVAPVTASCSSC